MAETFFRMIGAALIASPFWLPIALLAYVAAGERITVRQLFAFFTCECMAVAVFAWFLRSLGH
jgi:hypothetical protein